MDKLRILLFADEIEMDSPSVYAVDLADELLRQGHTVRLVCAGSRCDVLLSDLKSRKGTKDAASDGDVVLEMPGLKAPIVSFYRMFELRRIISSYKPDIIHATSETCAELARKAADAADTPYMFTCHRYIEDDAWRMSPNLSRVIAVSDDLREHIVNHADIPKELVGVVPNGVSIRKYDFTSNIEADRIPLIGTIGKLVARKGHSYFVKAAASILQSGYKAHFLVCGEGPEERSLRNLAAELEITEHITFSNFPFRAHSVIREMDVFVLTSLQESLGFSALEALAYGKAVVAFGVGGIYSFLKDGETGLVVNLKDVDGLAKAVSRLIDSPELRYDLGKKGRALVEERFSLEVTTNKVIEQYRIAIIDHRGRKIAKR
jgi:glycosyltransferase involved in cell wall biosynthesis